MSGLPFLSDKLGRLIYKQDQAPLGSVNSLQPADKGPRF
jgi:hypothetical protein